MPPSEIRKEAREALKGTWGKGVCIVLAYMLFSFLIGLVEGLVGEGTLLYSIIDLAYAIISIPLSFGLIISFMKLKRGEEVKAFGFLKDGFSRFGKSWGVAWHTFVKMLLPIACLIVIMILMSILFVVGSNSIIITLLSVALYIASIVYIVSRSLLYALAYYIGYDRPELSSKDCVKKSEDLMKGNRGNCFLLELSFIGWALLGVLTFGIGYLWLMPYMKIAMVCFYDRLAKPEVKKIDEEGKIEE